jgi:transposase-like protein
VGNVEIIGRVERRRKWTQEEKAALLSEIEAEGGRVTVVARRHRISESLLYIIGVRPGGWPYRCTGPIRSSSCRSA